MAGLLGGYIDPGRPKGDLGPRYTMRYVVSPGPETEVPDQPPVVQYLYPFADQGPLVYTPPGQKWIAHPDGEAREGWIHPDPTLMDVLTRRGLPTSAPNASEDAARTVPASGVPWAIAALTLFALVGAVTAARARRRRRMVAAVR